MMTYLDFEQGVAELEGKAEELKALARRDPQMDIAEEVARLSQKAETQLADLYAKLTPWRKTLVARHPARPHAADFIEGLIDEFTPLAGDRGFAEDDAMLSGLGRFRGQAVVVLGSEKGADTAGRLRRNFGMARPEGYRKAIRLMDLADRFHLPVLTFVDTPGAYPGKGAEQRGQAEAIARCTEKCLEIGVPLIAAITGEGGSGGAVAIATASRVLMLEHSIYSVISPEGCASILWKSAEKAEDAAAALKLTAQDLRKLGVIDGVIQEPMGGAHRDPAVTIASLGAAIETALAEMDGLSGPEIRAERRRKFIDMGRSLG